MTTGTTHQSELDALPAERVVVVGVGYVGLPLAVALAVAGLDVLGFDLNSRRVSQLTAGQDATGSCNEVDLASSGLSFSDKPADMKGHTCYIVTVPTPLTPNDEPDLSNLVAACTSIGQVIVSGALVIVESTVYPGATREVCRTVIEDESGLTCGEEFGLAYSPERINPGDSEHTLSTVVKLVAGYDAESSARAIHLYRRIVSVGVVEALSLEVAELAKIVENSQRDLNIAFSNEISRICVQLDLDTMTVLEACATKWNFQAFRPGLVGGHCIPVDSHYLIHRSQVKGYFPQLLAGVRETNAGMPGFLAQRLVRKLDSQGIPPSEASVALLGATFKADVPDTRNSGAVSVLEQLIAFGVDPVICDPLLSLEELSSMFGRRAVSVEELEDLDMIVVLVDHHSYKEDIPSVLRTALRPGGVFADFANLRQLKDMPADLSYMRL